jgi:RNA polymerase sigma factor (sigma-70 family)
MARERVLADFLPLIRRIARTYSATTALDTEEFVQEGVVGLFTALERYDLELGVPFWAYASWWVRREMQRLVAELTLPVVMSDRAMRQLASVRHARQEYEVAHYCDPTNRELVEATGYSEGQLDSLMCVELSPRSLEAPLPGDESTGGTLADLFADPIAEDGYGAVDRKLDAEVLRHRPNDLSERERAILRARYGFDGPAKTLQAVGTELELTAERVRQIQEHALETLRLAGSTVLSEVVGAYAGRSASAAGHLEGRSAEAEERVDAQLPSWTA